MIRCVHGWTLITVNATPGHKAKLCCLCLPKTSVKKNHLVVSVAVAARHDLYTLQVFWHVVHDMRARSRGGLQLSVLQSYEFGMASAAAR